MPAIMIPPGASSGHHKKSKKKKKKKLKTIGGFKQTKSNQLPLGLLKKRHAHLGRIISNRS